MYGSFFFNLSTFRCEPDSPKMVICKGKPPDLNCSGNIMVSIVVVLLLVFFSSLCSLHSGLESILTRAKCHPLVVLCAAHMMLKTFLIQENTFPPVLYWQFHIHFCLSWSLGWLMRIHRLKEHDNYFLLFPSESDCECCFVVY